MKRRAVISTIFIPALFWGAFFGVSPGTPGALNAELAILPFRVAGRPNPALFSRRELPVQLQRAALFLFDLNREYPLIRAETAQEAQRKVMGSSVPGSDPRFTRRRASRLCDSLRASYLLSGFVRFYSRARLDLSLHAYSCSNGRIAHRSRTRGLQTRLQKLLGRSLLRVSPFARRKPESLVLRGGKTRDLLFVLDASGSMHRDLPAIRRGIISALDRAPRDARVAVMLLGGGGKRRTLPYTRDRSRVKRFISDLRPFGDVRARDLLRALRVAAAYGEKRGGQHILLFTDAALDARGLLRLKARLRNLKANRSGISLFTLGGQKNRERRNWEAVARSLGLLDPRVLYARRLGFLDGGMLYLVSRGSRFYVSRAEIRRKVQTGSLSMTGLEPLDISRFRGENLNLRVLPELYARAVGRRLVRRGKIVSSLEKKIETAVLTDSGTGEPAHKFLVRSGKRAFWIGVNDPGTARALRRRRGRKTYLGLRFRPARGDRPHERLTNLADHVYIRPSWKIPRLFLNDWNRLRRLPSRLIRPEDVWFLLLEILEYKNVGEERELRR